jgi:hypothetical protein
MGNTSLISDYLYFTILPKQYPLSGKMALNQFTLFLPAFPVKFNRKTGRKIFSLSHS